MPPADRLINEYLDFASKYLRTGNWLNPASSAAALSAAIQAATNANLYLATRGRPVVGTTTPSDALYGPVQDMMNMVFVTAIPTQVQLSIPAPVAAVFGAGGQTVDPTNALVAAIISAAVGTLTDINGNPVTAFVSGVKSSRRTEQF